MDIIVHLSSLDYFWPASVSIVQKPVLLLQLFRFYFKKIVATLG